MKAGLCFEKKNAGRLAVAMIFAAALFVQKFIPETGTATAMDAGVSALVLLAFGACYFLIRSFTFEVKREGALPWIWSGFLLAAGSIFTA